MNRAGGCVRDYCFAMKPLSFGIVRASASSALAYSRLCSGKPDPATGGMVVGVSYAWFASECWGTMVGAE
ncbi:MAG: hypothetical protein LBQ31_05890 [Bacteroidales bacterium]|nr:hypothetical protein [Bacteroidales bacterium]